MKSDLKKGYYLAHAKGLKTELAALLDRDALREVHRRRPLRHFVVLARQLALLAGAISGIVLFRNVWWWFPFSVSERYRWLSISA